LPKTRFPGRSWTLFPIRARRYGHVGVFQQPANAALEQRGSLHVWFDPATLWLAEPGGKRGRSARFANAAIQTCLALKALFGLALRQAAWPVASLLQLAGLEWAVPDVATLPAPPERSERRHTLSARHGCVAPVDRQHRDQIRARRGVVRVNGGAKSCHGAAQEQATSSACTTRARGRRPVSRAPYRAGG